MCPPYRLTNSEEAQRALLGCFEERKRGSLTQYRTILTRTRRDPTFPEFASVSKRLQQKLAARRDECVQQRPSGGGALDFAELRSQAGKVKPQFDAFVEALATKCGAEKTAAPLKGAWRAIEKMALRVESAGEKCGALKDGPLDAAPLCDVLRGSLQCKDFTMLLTAFELLEALDAEFGDVAQARGLTQRIRLLRIKDRFTAPTAGGWADVLVNFVFVDDDSKHVCELQLQHESMLLVRKEGGGHEDYNEFRSAFELLEAVGTEPHDEFEDASRRDSVASLVQAGSEEVAALRSSLVAAELFPFSSPRPTTAQRRFQEPPSRAPSSGGQRGLRDAPLERVKALEVLAPDRPPPTAVCLLPDCNVVAV